MNYFGCFFSFFLPASSSGCGSEWAQKRDGGRRNEKRMESDL